MSIDGYFLGEQYYYLDPYNENYLLVIHVCK